MTGTDNILESKRNDMNSQNINEKLKIVDGLAKLITGRFTMMLKGPAMHRIKKIAEMGFAANMDYTSNTN